MSLYGRYIYPIYLDDDDDDGSGCTGRCLTGVVISLIVFGIIILLWILALINRFCVRIPGWDDSFGRVLCWGRLRRPEKAKGFAPLNEPQFSRQVDPIPVSMPHNDQYREDIQLSEPYRGYNGGPGGAPYPPESENPFEPHNSRPLHTN